MTIEREVTLRDIAKKVMAVDYAQQTEADDDLRGQLIRTAKLVDRYQRGDERMKEAVLIDARGGIPAYAMVGALDSAYAKMKEMGANKRERAADQLRANVGDKGWYVGLEVDEEAQLLKGIRGKAREAIKLSLAEDREPKVDENLVRWTFGSTMEEIMRRLLISPAFLGQEQ